LTAGVRTTCAPAAVSLAIALCCAAPRAHAQDAANDVEARSRAEFVRGVDATHEGRWSDALEAFQHAYEIAPHPETLLNVASALAHMGRLVDASSAYARFLRDAPPALLATHGDAAREALAHTEAAMARVRLTVEGLEPTDIVTLDAHALDHGALQRELPMDPGEHDVAVARAGRVVTRTHLRIGEGETKTVVLRPPVASAIAPVPPRADRGARERPREHHPTDSGSVLESPWFWIATGAIVAVATGVTIYFVAIDGATGEPYEGNYTPSGPVHVH